MISFQTITELFSSDLEGRFCVEIQFLLKGSPRYQSCWMGKMPDREDKEKEIKAILTTVYDALRQKGYNPINQIVGYILSEDPTYVTTHNNARSLIRRIDRDELLQILVKNYLND